MKRLLFLIIMLIALVVAGCGDSDNKTDDIAKITNTNEQQTANIINILKDCGFEKYDIKVNSKLDNATGASEKAFLIKVDDPTPINLLLAPNGSVYKIYIPNHDIYANGKVQNKITDFIFTTDEKEKLMGIAKTIVIETFKKNGMQDDEQAKFYDKYDWLFTKEPQTSIVSSYVIVTNNSGTDKRRYDFTMTLDTANGKVLNFDFDNSKMDKIPEENESILHSILK